MIRPQVDTDLHPQPTQTGRAYPHPAWCDLTRCTADPASQADRFQPGGRSENWSAPIPLTLPAASLPGRDGTASLSEACAPRPCAVFLRAHPGDLELSMSADYAAPVIDAPSALLALVANAEGVTR